MPESPRIDDLKRFYAIKDDLLDRTGGPSEKLELMLSNRNPPARLDLLYTGWDSLR